MSRRTFLSEHTASELAELEEFYALLDRPPAED